METRANRPVSMIIASSLLALYTCIPGPSPTQPRARDPPRRCNPRYQFFQRGLRRVCNSKTGWGGPPRAEGLAKEEAARQHRLSRTPDSRS
jgi:hypothetical protein